MGTLIGMAYPIALRQADHTYVKCGTGGAAWACWGGKTGGRALRLGPGSTNRADRIAQPDERANIKCYLITGVCHQAANRILLPAGMTVRGARGYSVSQALFGTYGRAGGGPCKSPFLKYPGVTGDLPQCTRKRRPDQADRHRAQTELDELDRRFIESELEIYRKADALMRGRVRRPSAIKFHIRLFMHMAEFNLGAMLDKSLARTLEQVRTRIPISNRNFNRPSQNTPRVSGPSRDPEVVVGWWSARW